MGMNTVESGWWQQAPIVDINPNRRARLRSILRAVGLTAGLTRIWWPVMPVVVFLSLWGPGGAALDRPVCAMPRISV